MTEVGRPRNLPEWPTVGLRCKAAGKEPTSRRRSMARRTRLIANISFCCHRIEHDLAVSIVAAITVPQPRADDLRGTAEVCIRWDGPCHIADAVVVRPSGNPMLDASLPATIKAMAWQHPDQPYNGGWMGVTVAVIGAPSEMPLPSCDKLSKPLSAAKPDQPRQLGPVDRIEPAMFGHDRHNAADSDSSGPETKGENSTSSGRVKRKGLDDRRSPWVIGRRKV